MKQTVSKQVTKKETRNRREGRGRVIALSQRIFCLQGKDTYYVESENSNSRFYFVRFNSSFAGKFCSCKDYDSNRPELCRHQHAVFYGIKYNTIKEVEHLPEDVRTKRDTTEEDKPTIESKCWEDDEYSF